MIKHFNLKNLPVFNIDPSLNQALLYMLAEGLISKDGDKFTISDKGKQLIKLIGDDDECFDDEERFLKSIGKKFTDTKVDEIINFMTKIHA